MGSRFDYALVPILLCALMSGKVDAQELLVADSGNHDIRRFDASTGAYLGRLGDRAGLLGSGQFTVGPDGSLYVAHFDFAQLVKLDGRTGDFLDSAGLQGRPLYPRFGPDGLLYFNVTTAAGEILRYDSATLTPAGTLPVANHQGDFRFGPDGNLYVVNRDGGTIDVFDVRAGQYVDRDPSTPQRDPFARLSILDVPEQIAFGPNGDVFGIEFRRIVRFDGKTGALLGDFVPAPPEIGDPGPRSLVFGPDGNLYVSDDDGRILRYDGDDGTPLGVFVGEGVLDRPGAMVFVPAPGGAVAIVAAAWQFLRRRTRRVR